MLRLFTILFISYLFNTSAFIINNYRYKTRSKISIDVDLFRLRSTEKDHELSYNHDAGGANNLFTDDSEFDINLIDETVLDLSIEKAVKQMLDDNSKPSDELTPAQKFQQLYEVINNAIINFNIYFINL